MTAVVMKLRCVICGKEIPEERAARKAVTCGKGCLRELHRRRRALVDSRRCRKCYRPSTPEQRAQFKKWMRTERPARP